MSRWFRIDSSLLNVRSVQTLSDAEFREKFIAAINGEDNEFSSYLEPVTARLPWNEWAQIRLYVFQLDNFTCQYCGAAGVPLECDHVIPVSRGGSNEKSNLKTACRSCNREKSDRTLEELGWAHG